MGASMPVDVYPASVRRVERPETVEQASRRHLPVTSGPTHLLALGGPTSLVIPAAVIATNGYLSHAPRQGRENVAHCRDQLRCTGQHPRGAEI